MRIINNTNLAIERLLVLYGKELSTVRHLNIECIVFENSLMRVFGIDCLLLEVS